MTNVAVVILNYNGERFLRQFLPSVVQYSSGAEIVVADNASTDASLAILKTEFPSVRIIALSENYGFCGGYNRAFMEVHTEYAVLLNSDVEVSEHWLTPLLTLLEENPSIAAVQPKIKSYHAKHSFEYAGAGGGYMDSLGYPFCRGRLFDFLENDTGQYNDVQEIFWATGACMVVRTSLYKQVKGLDEDFFAHMEEIDLCWRMKKLNHSIYYHGGSTVYHVGGGTLSKLNPRKTFLNFRNGLFLITKNFNSVELLWKLPLRLLLDDVAMLRFLFSGQHDHARSILVAHFYFLRSFGKLMGKRKETKSSTPENRKGRYHGLIIWDYFVRGRKKIVLD